MTRLILCLLSAASCHAGTASYYSWDHAGRITASGVPFNPAALTCASWHYPLGTRLRVSHGGRSVVVVCNDRGPARRLRREIDLSEAAFRKLAPTEVGLIEVKIRKVK